MRCVRPCLTSERRARWWAAAASKQLVVVEGLPARAAGAFQAAARSETLGSNTQGACESCPAGQFGNEKGLLQCKKCPVDSGTYQDQSGGAACKFCVVGKFQQYQYKTVCKDCQPGEFQPDPEKSACKKCAKVVAT